MNALFLNEYGRLRSGWRFGFFIALFIFLSVPAAAVAGFILQIGAGQLGDTKWVADGTGRILLFVLAIGIGWFCGRYLEGLPFRAIGASFSSNWLKDFLIGNVIAIVSISMAALIAVAFGGLRFRFNPDAETNAILTSLGVSFFIFLLVSLSEEALFRGYILQTFTRAKLAWFAIAMTSLFFSAAHLGNQSASFFSTLNTALAGVWLGIAYLKTRTLWLVFGLHLSWNWFQGAVFGIEVSGFKDFAGASVLTEVDSGPAWVTGGDYGLEGGIACTIVLILSTAVIWYAPFLNSTEEMQQLTGTEKPRQPLYPSEADDTKNTDI